MIFFSNMEGVPPSDQAHGDLMLEKIGGIIVYLPANQGGFLMGQAYACAWNPD